LAALPSAVISMSTKLQPARRAFQIAQAFDAFYHDYPVTHERDPERRAFLPWMPTWFRDRLEGASSILGIPVPPYM